MDVHADKKCKNYRRQSRTVTFLSMNSHKWLELLESLLIKVRCMIICLINCRI